MREPTFTAAELATEARRELALRKKVYLNRVHTGRLKPSTAQRQIAMMQAILDILEGLEEAERLL